MKKLDYDIFMLYYNQFPGWATRLAKITGWDADLIDYAAQYMDNLLTEIEQDYLENELPKVKKTIQEWIKEDFPEEFKEERRHTYMIMQSLETGKPLWKYQDEVEKARQVPLVDFLRSRGIIKQNEYMIKCPFHNDRVPSLDTRKNFYYCYGCGAKGDTIDFVMKYENVSFKQAIQILNTL